MVSKNCFTIVISFVKLLFLVYFENKINVVLQKWKELKEEEMKTKLAESARYKMYRRYMKKGGAGHMTFGPE